MTIGNIKNKIKNLTKQWNSIKEKKKKHQEFPKVAEDCKKFIKDMENKIIKLKTTKKWINKTDIDNLKEKVEEVK